MLSIDVKALYEFDLKFSPNIMIDIQIWNTQAIFCIWITRCYVDDGVTCIYNVIATDKTIGNQVEWCKQSIYFERVSLPQCNGSMEFKKLAK